MQFSDWDIYYCKQVFFTYNQLFQFYWLVLVLLLLDPLVISALVKLGGDILTYGTMYTSTTEDTSCNI